MISIIPPLTFRTSRLKLNAAQPEHAVSLFEEYTGKDDAARYLQRRAHASAAHTQAIIDAAGEKNWLENNRFAWTILLSDGRAIGLFLMFTENTVAEIHYGIGTAYRGRGFATEAGKAFMDWGVGESSLSEITTCCATQHIASLRVLEKIGLKRIKFLPAYLHVASTEKTEDGWLYQWKRP